MGTATSVVTVTQWQCSLGSLLQAKSCSTYIFWAERLLACSQAWIISYTQITSLYRLHGCHMGSCPHLGMPWQQAAGLPADGLHGESGWPRQQPAASIASVGQSSSWEGLFCFTIFLLVDLNGLHTGLNAARASYPFLWVDNE